MAASSARLSTSLDYAISAGYAGVSSDLGHRSYGTDASWALNRTDLVQEFGYSATHDMTVAAKTFIHDYYGTAQTHSYFYGGSAGGRQGLMEAQRYPTDYNGIASLSPAQNWTHITSGMIAQELDLGGSGSSNAQLTAAQATALNDAVVKACDALDGLTDGLITDPTKCAFDPVSLSCAKKGGANCLSDAQLAAVKKLYRPLTRSASAASIVYGPLPYGSEYEWSCSVLHDAFNFPFADSWFQNEVYADPAWDFKTFNVNVDVPYADALLGDTLNASSPNLDSYKAAGGKLLIAQGQSDAIVVPQNTTSIMRRSRIAMARTPEISRVYSWNLA